MKTKTEIQKDPDLRALISKAKTAQDSLEILKKYNQEENPFLKIKEDSSTKSAGRTNLVKNYQTLESYDSVQKTLPSAAKGWLADQKNKHTELLLLNSASTRSRGYLSGS